MYKLLCCAAMLCLYTAVQAAHQLENRYVQFSFSEKTGELQHILNKTTQRKVQFTPDGQGLWQLQLLSGTETVSTVNGALRPSFAVQKTNGGQTAVLKWSGSHKENRFSVEVKVVLSDDSSIADVSSSVKMEGAPADWVENLVCPRLTGINSLGDDILYYGFQQGLFVHDPINRLKSAIKIFYPGRWSIPLAVYAGSNKLKCNGTVEPGRGEDKIGFFRGPADDETALFLAAPDAGYYHKDFSIEPGKNSFSMICSNMPSYKSWPRDPVNNSDRVFAYTTPYVYKLGTYTGGIGTGAEIFRELVKGMPHMRKGKIRDADGNAHNTNPQLLDTVYWGKYYHAANKVVPEMLDAFKTLQVPCGLHWYRYYVNMFDDNNLDYLPTMPFFREGVEALKRQGLLVAPYICFAMWDPDTESFRRKGMIDSALKERDGSIMIWNLSEGPNYWMNPASKKWRDEYIALADKMFGQFGINAQYIDVLPTASKQGYDPNLGTIHGGNYWSRGNNQMLDDLHRSINRFEKDAVILGEGFSDDSLAGIDCSYVMGGPLFSLIYHDYSCSYGSDIHQGQPADHYRWGIGRMFHYGSQLSLSSYGPVPFDGKKQPGDRLLVNLAQAWHQAGNKFLNGGRGIETAQVPEASLTGRAPVGIVSDKITVRISNRNYTWRGPALVGSSWEAYDNSIGITIANITDISRKGKLIIQPEFLKPAGSVLYQTWPLPVKKIAELDMSKPFILDFEVEADQGAIFELAGDRPPQTRALVTPPAITVTPSVELKGEFPVTPLKTDTLYSSYDALLDNRFRNGGNALTLYSETTRLPFRVSTYAAKWTWFHGRGAQRPLNDVGFHLLKETPLSIGSNGFARINGADGVAEAQIEMVEPGILKVDPNSVCVIKERNGNIQLAGREFAVLPGKTYFAAVFPESMLKLNPQSLEKDLAQFTFDTANEAETLLTGDSNLPNPVREKAELLLRAGNAAAYVLSRGGARVAYDARHDWLIPMISKRVRFINWDRAEKVIAESVKILNRDLAEQVTVKPLAEQSFELRVNQVDAASNLLRVFYSLEVENPAGLRFRMSKLRYEEVAEPILIKLNDADVVNYYNENTRKISFLVRLRNVSNDDLPIRVSAELPEGWRVQDIPEFKMPALQEKMVEIFIEHDGKVFAKDDLPGKVFFNYTGDDSTRHEETFILKYHSSNLVPVEPSAPLKQPVSNIRRDYTKVAVIAESDTIKMEVQPGVYTRLPDKLSYVVLDSGMQTVSRGELEFREKKFYPLEIPVPVKGVYYIKFYSLFAHFRFLNIRHYGYCAEFDNRYHFNGGTTTLYFYVKPGAKEFEFAGLDGSEGQGLEPGGITIIDPAGKVHYDRYGSYGKDRWYRVNVPQGCDGKVWKVVVKAFDDFDLMFRGSGVSRYLSFDPESLLTD